jgi:hypothetical protein
MFRRIVGALIALSLLTAATPAQRKPANPKKTAGKNLGNKEKPGETKEGQSISQKATDPPIYTAGEVRRIVKGDESPVLHLGMAASGATVVEFPASDHYFGVHTSDIGDWVRVERSPTSRIDSHIVLRPGKDLEKGESAGIVQVQMKSGLTVTLCVHPVKSSAYHTNRAVIVYDRDTIVAARKNAGLAVNLGDESELRPVIAAVAPEQPAVVEEKLPVPAPATVISNEAGEQKDKAKAVDPKMTKGLKKALKEAMSDSGSSFKVWSRPAHGLSVATRMRSLDDETRVALVAVKNFENTPIQILNDHPELVIETVNKDKIIQLKRLDKLWEEATTESNIIPARSTVYYAVAFAPPILGKRQRVRVTVGQRNAADDPAAANLIGK